MNIVNFLIAAFAIIAAIPSYAMEESIVQKTMKLLDFRKSRIALACACVSKYPPALKAIEPPPYNVELRLSTKEGMHKFQRGELNDSNTPILTETKYLQAFAFGNTVDMYSVNDRQIKWEWENDGKTICELSRLSGNLFCESTQSTSDNKLLTITKSCSCRKTEDKF